MFKFCYLNGEKIEQIYVFSKEKEPNILFEDAAFQDIPITIIPHQIHLDDSIETIKKKMIHHIDPIRTFDELYLFAKKNEQLHANIIYKQLTKNGKIDLTHNKLSSFLHNIDQDIRIPQKEIYDFADLNALNITTLKKISIGQRLVAHKKYPFTTNPFDLEEQDTGLAVYGDDILSTQNKNLLFETGNIHDNIIFFCLASDVLDAKADIIPSETLIKIYFPYLYDKKITTKKN